MNVANYLQLSRIMKLMAMGVVLLTVIMPAYVQALPVNFVNGLSPSNGQVDGGGQWHSLVMTGHGKVQRVDVGMYFDDNLTDKEFTINVGGSCLITAPNPAYPPSNVYVEILIGNTVVDTATGNQVCGALDGRRITIPAGSLAQYYDGTRFYGAPVSLRWTNAPGARNAIANADNQVGSHFRFRFNITGPGKVSLIDSSSSGINNTNNSMVHNGATQDPSTMYFPFGLDCNQGAVRRGQVSVYDADNGTATQPTPVRFYVGTVDSSGNITPLSVGDYRGRGPGAAANLADIWWDEDDGFGADGSRTPDPGSSLPNQLVGSANVPAPNHPVFYPGNFGNKGGVTTVAIQSVQPSTHYVLVIERINAGQFVYIGLPGDGLYGSPDFDYSADCRSVVSPTVTPAAIIYNNASGTNMTTGSYVDAGTPLNVSGELTADTGGDANVTASWQGWLDRNGDGIFNGTDSQIGQVSNVNVAIPSGTTVTIPGSSFPTTADGAFAQVCSRVYNLTPIAPTDVSTNEVVNCILISRRPYFEVLNGDANAAAGLAPTCTPPNPVTNGTISGLFVSGQGARAQIAAFATGPITEFASSYGSPTVKALTFANNAADTYGGNSELTYCIPDDTNAFWGTNRVVGNTAVGPQANITGQDTLIVQGDIYIRGSMTYDPANFALSNIPSRKYYATGNIYIDNNVTQLDGVYGATGVIYTCGVDNGVGGLRAAGAAGNLNELAGCNNQLVVNGAFIAGGGVKLQRMYDTIGGQPAERFVYTPETWLQGLFPSDNPSPGADSITSLPPIL